MNQDIFDPILDILFQEGYSEDKASKTVVALMDFLAEQFSQEMMAGLSDEKIKEIEEAESQEHANYLLSEAYFDVTSKNAEDGMNDLAMEFVEKFVDEYVKNKEEAMKMLPSDSELSEMEKGADEPMNTSNDSSSPVFQAV